jgi:hypothetical protein
MTNAAASADCPGSEGISRIVAQIGIAGAPGVDWRPARQRSVSFTFHIKAPLCSIRAIFYGAEQALMLVGTCGAS